MPTITVAMCVLVELFPHFTAPRCACYRWVMQDKINRSSDSHRTLQKCRHETPDKYCDVVSMKEGAMSMTQVSYLFQLLEITSTVLTGLSFRYTLRQHHTWTSSTTITCHSQMWVNLVYPLLPDTDSDRCLCMFSVHVLSLQQWKMPWLFVSYFAFRQLPLQ